MENKGGEDSDGGGGDVAGLQKVGDGVNIGELTATAQCMINFFFFFHGFGFS